MRKHFILKNKSIPLLGTHRHRGSHARPNSSGKHHLKGGAMMRGGTVQMILSEPELSQHGLEKMYIDRETIGSGVHRKKHIKPLHFKY